MRTGSEDRECLPEPSIFNVRQIEALRDISAAQGSYQTRSNPEQSAAVYEAWLAIKSTRSFEALLKQASGTLPGRRMCDVGYSSDYATKATEGSVTRAPPEPPRDRENENNGQELHVVVRA